MAACWSVDANVVTRDRGKYFPKEQLQYLLSVGGDFIEHDYRQQGTCTYTHTYVVHPCAHMQKAIFKENQSSGEDKNIRIKEAIQMEAFEWQLKEAKTGWQLNGEWMNPANWFLESK